MTTKRVYELEVGDTFMYGGVERKVMYIGGGKIFYKPLHFANAGTRDSFGMFNEMKVQITGKWAAKIKTKPKVYA